MKNLLFGLIATTMFGFLGNAQSSFKFSDYGLYHNEALSDFTKKYGENQQDISFIIDECIKLMQIKHPDVFKDSDGVEIKRLFAVKTANEFDFKKIWNTNKDSFYKDNIIPQRLGNLIDKIVNNNSSYEQAIEMMNDFEKSNVLKLDEANGLVAIKSVLVSSNQYWSSTSEKKHAIGSATLIADFAGAAMFLWTGWAAAVCGFACSYLTLQNDN